MELSYLDRPLDYCCIMSFSSTSLEQPDFEVRLRQVHSDDRARVPLGGQIAKIFVDCRSEQVLFYVGVDGF